MTRPLPEVLAELAGCLAELTPGHVPARLVVVFTDGEKVRLPFPAAAATPARPSPFRPLPPARHSSDFRSVRWYGTDHQFSPTQAAAVRVLWQAWEAGTRDMGQAAILEQAGSEGNRLRDVFRGRAGEEEMHPAWGTMIVATGAANARTYRLQEGD